MSNAVLDVNGKPSVEIMVDTFGSDGIPHTFLRLTDSNGTIYNYGFIPIKTSLKNIGKIDTSNHEWNFKSDKYWVK